MNDLQNKLLGGLVAVRITSEEDFKQIIEFLAIKNCFTVGNEPVSKMNYPGDYPFVICRGDDTYFYWELMKDVNAEKYQLVDVKQLELNLIDDQKIIEANATVTGEVVELNEKALTLVTNTKPEGATIDSNVDSLVALIPVIQSKANVVVTEENYKSFIAKGTGVVPELRKWAKAIDDERKRSKKVYMDSFNTYENKVKSVVEALNTTAQKIADDVDVYIQEKKDKLRKEREGIIEQLKEILIKKEIISREYANKFVFDEKWLNASCSNKKFQSEAETQFNDLMNQENLYKKDMELIESTIINTCTMVGVDEKLISRGKYKLQYQVDNNLGDITKNITDEINALKTQKEALKAEAEKELQHQKVQLETQHKKELEKVQQEAVQQPSIEPNKDEQIFKRGDEIIAKTTGKYVVTEIKETPEKFNGKTWTKTFEFTGDLASLQMLNRYMEFLKQSKEFDFNEVKMIEKELVEPETGTVSKYNVKEIN